MPTSPAQAVTAKPPIFLGFTRSVSRPAGRPDKHFVQFGVLSNTDSRAVGYPAFTITQTVELAEDPVQSIGRVKGCQ